MLYNQVPGYKKDETWKEIAVHDDKNILGFFGPYRFLSNFWDCKIEVNGLIYPGAEQAFQAEKVVPSERYKFQRCSAADSKTLWKKCTLVDKNAQEWDARKYKVMDLIVFSKFDQNKDLAELLLATGDKYLEELNWWNDRYWGVDCKTGRGENNLGHILMDVRDDLRWAKENNKLGK